MHVAVCVRQLGALGFPRGATVPPAHEIFPGERGQAPSATAEGCTGRGPSGRALAVCSAHGRACVGPPATVQPSALRYPLSPSLDLTVPFITSVPSDGSFVTLLRTVASLLDPQVQILMGTMLGTAFLRSVRPAVGPGGRAVPAAPAAHDMLRRCHRELVATYRRRKRDADNAETSAAVNLTFIAWYVRQLESSLALEPYLVVYLEHIVDMFQVHPDLEDSVCAPPGLC